MTAKAKTTNTKGKTGKAVNKETQAGVQTPDNVLYDHSLISDYDIYLFKEGKHFTLYEKMGAHVTKHKGSKGVFFAVWAPNAREVSVIGDFNNWKPGEYPLQVRNDETGIWQGFIPGLKKGDLYKYHIVSNFNNYTVEKTDPIARYNEVPPNTSSVVWDWEYTWNDKDWMQTRKEKNNLDAPMSVYELHLESWRRVPEEDNRYLTYQELAHSVAEYVSDMGYTHIELLPVMEHPFSGSWGYQVLGFFAPTSRFGTPQDFMYFVDTMHRHNIGVILDWVPSHFPGDLHGLHYFDGTNLYEHQDPKQGYHPDWSSYIFNYGRAEVKDFLISSAHVWLDKYHIDGLRVDAVASMLYLDYSRKDGEWIPNEHGGRENLHAIRFMREMNESVYERFPDIQTIAEESTAWPMVTRPVYTGGLGFGMKWNMGWMHDTLNYFAKDPVYRSYHHNQITFSIWYAFNENFMLSLSHDEVVHGKGSLINKMPGDPWQKFANLRALFGYMFTHPGKKLMFMGMEIGQWAEWNHERSIDWHLLDHDLHAGLKAWIRDMNACYKNFPALYELDFLTDGFKWLDANDSKNSILSFARYSKEHKDRIFVVCNFTPAPQYNYRVGVPEQGNWKEVLNSDAHLYGGSGQGNMGAAEATPVPYHEENYSINITLPPLSMVMFRKE
ncbi:MAG: 1,4-alpha-glucan branching protein GlgB [Bacteroidetes bacterium]|jgi:1,4-alpha-glucan branching enzyme|nr:1,4-alpha-glucan branching protein GlgB [Bacteroidota bacterium]